MGIVFAESGLLIGFFLPGDSLLLLLEFWQLKIC
jgi:membrane protein DedA with SNARE-associated domain